MEEQLTSLLKNSIENAKTIKYDKSILEKYYQLLEIKKYSSNNFEEIYKDMKNAYHIDLQSLQYGYENNTEQTVYKNLITSIINETNAKDKEKLMPLIIYLDNNRILYDYLYKIDYFKSFVCSIKYFFIEAIKAYKIEDSNIEKLSAYCQEKERYYRYKDGINNLLFKQIYSFIGSIERGMGYQFNDYMDFLVFILYKYFFDDLVSIANDKKDMLEVIHLINTLNIEEKLHLAVASNNYLLKFEAIRKATYSQCNNYSCLILLKYERELLENLIIYFSKKQNIWKQFLAFYLEYPSKSIQLFEPFSKAILEVDEDCIPYLVQSIRINEHTDDDSKKALSSFIFNIKDNKIQKYIVEELFYKWEKYINDCDEDLLSIVSTDIIDIVIFYVRDYLDKDIIEINIKKILDNLNEINNYWFKDKSEQTNYFYKEMSKLFVYGYSLDKYKLYDLRHKITTICADNIILEKEDDKITLWLFREYVLQNSIVDDK